MSAVTAEMVIDRTDARRLRLFPQSLPRLQADQLLRHPYLASPHVQSSAPQPDQLAAAHPRVDSQIDEAPVPLVVGLGQADGLVP